MLKLTKEEQVFLAGFRAGICHIGSPLSDWPDADLWSIGADHQYHKSFGGEDAIVAVVATVNTVVPEPIPAANQTSEDTAEPQKLNPVLKKRGRPAKGSA